MAGLRQLPPLHCALEAVLMVEVGTAAVVTTLWWASCVSCRLALDTRLTGLLASSDRFCGLRKSGVPPALALANSRLPLPSREVMGRVPLEANAVEKKTKTSK